MVAIILTVFGDTLFARDLLKVAYRGNDMRPAFNAIHLSFLGIERRQFATQGEFSGGWEPLSPRYVEYKRRHGLDPRILVATGALRRSLTTTGANHVFHVTPDEMFIGSRVNYGIFHQSRAPRQRLPRRPPVSLTSTHKRRWVRILQRYLMTGEL